MIEPAKKNVVRIFKSAFSPRFPLVPTRCVGMQFWHAAPSALTETQILKTSPSFLYRHGRRQNRRSAPGGVVTKQRVGTRGHRLLVKFEELTGFAVLINTSFNRQSPIVLLVLQA